MGSKTSIEWTRGEDGSAGATWTPIRARNKVTGAIGWHCEHASPGCVHCYSESLNRDRLGTRLPFKPGHRADVELFLDEKLLTQPLRWKRPRKIFVCSMTDLFADFVPDEWIDKVFAVMALARQHTFQVLTKRSTRMRAYLSNPGVFSRIHDAAVVLDRQIIPNPPPAQLTYFDASWPLRNVWLGVSAEDQARADQRVLDLLATPAVIRYVSAEPLLGPIDFRNLRLPRRTALLDALTCDVKAVDGEIIAGPPAGHGPLDWIIVGGESGPGARAMHPAWVRSIRDQCAAAGVAFLFKQWGEWRPSTPEEAYGNPRSGWTSIAGKTGKIGRLVKVAELHPEAGGAFVERVGKKAAGRLLDGVEHNGMPRAAA